MRRRRREPRPRRSSSERLRRARQGDPEGSGAESKTTITVGSKNFTEQFILGEIYAQALEAAGYKVKKRLDLGSEQIAFKALQGGKIDAYPEYTGTALTSFFGVKTADIPKDPDKAYEQAKAGYAKEDITALPPTPFKNTYRLGMTRKARRRSATRRRSPSSRARTSDLSISGFPECRQRPDCLLGLEDDLRPEVRQVPLQRAQVQGARHGDSDIAFVFSTDGELAGDKYVLLEDDKKLFPPYNVTFGVRNEAMKKLGPEGRRSSSRSRAAHREGHAGAQLPRRPRQAEARARWPRPTSRRPASQVGVGGRARARRRRARDTRSMHRPRRSTASPPPGRHRVRRRWRPGGDDADAGARTLSPQDDPARPGEGRVDADDRSKNFTE